MASNSYSKVSRMIKSSLEQITLDDNDILPVIQCIEISPNDQPDIKLLELDSTLYQHVISGKPLTFRGEENDSAVLCTPSATYEVKEAEVSSPLPVLSNLLYPEDCSKPAGVSEEDNLVSRQVLGVFNSYYEVIPCAPKFKKLYKLLEKSAYQGEEFEDESIEKYTRNDILKYVQSSEDELTEALNKIHTCIINGYVRILDTSFKYEVVSRMISTAESESFPYDKVPKKHLKELLESLYDAEVLEHCFSWILTDTGLVSEDGDILCTFQKDEICRLYAETLLKPFSKFSLRDFLESWQKSVPEGMTANVSQLEGLALIDRLSKPEVIKYFPAHDLPESIQDRLNELFQIKPKWTYQEIYPYIKDLETSTVSSKAVLLKFCRSFVENDVEVFCSKWYISDT